MFLIRNTTVVVFITIATIQLKADIPIRLSLQLGMQYLGSSGLAVFAQTPGKYYSFDVGYRKHVGVLPGVGAAIKLGNGFYLKSNLNVIRMRYDMEHRNLKPDVYPTSVILTRFKGWEANLQLLIEKRFLKNECLGIEAGITGDYQSFPSIQTIPEDEINIRVRKQITQGFAFSLSFYPKVFGTWAWSSGYTYLLANQPQFSYEIRRNIGDRILYQFSPIFRYHCVWVRYSFGS